METHGGEELSVGPQPVQVGPSKCVVEVVMVTMVAEGCGVGRNDDTALASTSVADVFTLSWGKISESHSRDLHGEGWEEWRPGLGSGAPQDAGTLDCLIRLKLTLGPDRLDRYGLPREG